jgi:hypothetical protein
MPLLGQASGGWLESSSALRILYVGVRNSVGVLTADAFTQTNPPTETAAGSISTSEGMSTSTLGVLSGSVAFTRGANEIGGVGALGAGAAGVVPLGVFINTAVGNAFENQPAVASDKCPYVSAQGTFGNQLFETQSLVGGAPYPDLTYTAGDALFASVNGYLTNNAADEYDAGGGNPFSDLIIGVLKMPADSEQPEIVYDQRI